MNAKPVGTWAMRWIRLRCLLRRFGFHRGTMCRQIDRTQSVIGFGLVLVFVTLAPIVAAGVFQYVYGSGVRTEQRQHATRHPVHATVVQRNVPAASAADQIAGRRDLVEWRAADGSRHSDLVYTGKKAGAHVTYWVDRAGAITAAPQTRTQTIGTAAFAGAGGLTAVALPLLSCYALVRRRFDGRRFAAWDDEWTLISPHWTGRS
jgi:hypothetical protein